MGTDHWRQGQDSRTGLPGIFNQQVIVTLTTRKRFLKTTSDTDCLTKLANQSLPSRQALQRAFDLCVSKTRSNIKRLADEPKSAAWAVDGNYFAYPEGFL